MSCIERSIFIRYLYRFRGDDERRLGEERDWTLRIPLIDYLYFTINLWPLSTAREGHHDAITFAYLGSFSMWLMIYMRLWGDLNELDDKSTMYPMITQSFKPPSRSNENKKCNLTKQNKNKWTKSDSSRWSGRNKAVYLARQARAGGRINTYFWKSCLGSVDRLWLKQIWTWLWWDGVTC